MSAMLFSSELQWSRWLLISAVRTVLAVEFDADQVSGKFAATGETFNGLPLPSFDISGEEITVWILKISNRY